MLSTACIALTLGMSPTSIGVHCAPPLAVIRTAPAVSIEKPVLASGNDTSVIAWDVGTPIVAHALPPSIERATRPRSPVACTSCAFVARTRDSCNGSPPPSRSPIPEKPGVAVELPASVENTVAPNSPTPTALVWVENVNA